jgi:YhcH/YjgK/YiaL family protein
MILDRLDQFHRYTGLHPGFEAAFQFLYDRKWAGLPTGRHTTPEPRIYASVDRKPGRGIHGAELEFHRLYIDIQYTVEGSEVIGWRNLGRCEKLRQEYDSARDCGLYADVPDSWVGVPPGCFAIFYPDDAHAPLAGEGPLHKVIMKVPAIW